MRGSWSLWLVVAALGACGGTTSSTSDAGDVPATDADAPAADTALPMDVATGDGGGACSFNRECIASERCECDERAGCRCAPGVRGTGRAGASSCATGNDCESGLCVEATGGGFLCSMECDAPAACPSSLPRCVAVPSVGRFCARDPSATPDAAVDAPPDCTGACATTTLMGVFGDRRGGFERAQHGNDGERLHVEAHFGGARECPTMTSPTPRRTLVLSGVRATAATTPQTEADGLSASLLDFGGDLTSAPVVRATAVRVVPRAFVRGSHVSLEVTATFAGGTITGALFAPHCMSLDE